MKRTRAFSLRQFGTVATAAFTLSLLAGCAGGPSQEELSVLEQKSQSVEALEQQVADKKAEKSRLERKLAEKKATKKALEDKKAATKAALAGID